MEQNKFKDLLNHYFKDNANETEAALVDAWYKSYQSKENEIEVSEEEKEKAKHDLKLQLWDDGRKRLQAQRYFFLKIAASFIIALTITFLFFNKNSFFSDKITYSLVNTGIGQVKRIVLPDSSIAWLNAASSLRVPSNFNGDERNVFLDEGEAYFEVAKNANKPFIVKSPKLKVQVLGTSFNVNAYKNLLKSSVSVAIGKVRVDHDSTKIAVLTPQQELIFDHVSGKYIQLKTDHHSFREWREGKFNFKQAGFRELALVLKNNFNIQLKAGKPKVEEYQFTINLNSAMNPEQVLNLISAIHDSHYRKEGNEMILY